MIVYLLENSYQMRSLSEEKIACIFGIEAADHL